MSALRLGMEMKSRDLFTKIVLGAVIGIVIVFIIQLICTFFIVVKLVK